MKKVLKLAFVLIVLGIFAVAYGLFTMPSRPYDQAQFKHENQQSLDESIARGKYVAITADCIACHKTKDHQENFSGGLALETPFGNIFASNITPDEETGIGRWSEEQFADAVRNGKGPNGPLYPAMPYTNYVKMSDQDIHDLWNYMRTIEPVNHKVEENQMPFPFNIRYLVLGWKRLFFDASPISAKEAMSNTWERGRYLVEGAAHCSMCHTPRNFLGAEQKSKAFSGASLANWYAPSLTASQVEGLGHWSEDDLIHYLKTGSNKITVASGPMAEAVTASFQHFTDDDLKAVATYIKSLPSGQQNKQDALTNSHPQMQRGKTIYFDNCIACHKSNGTGVANMIPAFSGNAAVQAANIDSLAHVLLVGSQGAITKFNPTGASMPGFAWKFNDQDTADVLTYIRNTWGNAATAVSANDISKMRQTLKARQPFNDPKSGL